MGRLLTLVRGHRVRAALVRIACCALVAALMGSCTAADSGRPKAPGQAHGEAVRLTGSVIQIRPDEGTRRLRAAVTNGGTESVTLTTASLAWAGFEPNPMALDDEPLPPGETAGLVLEYGDPRCRTAPSARPRLLIGTDRGEVPIALRLQDPTLLERLHQRECGLARLGRTVAVRLDLDTGTVQHGVPREEYLPGAVVLRRRPGSSAPVTLVDLGGTVLFDFVPAERGGLPVVLPSGDNELRLPVLIGSAHRCDGHALGQASQPFLFAVYAGLHQAPVQRLIMATSPGEQAALRGILRRDCR